MADDKLKEDPIFARLRDKGQPPAGLKCFVGLLGESPRPGYWLLYSNLDMSRSVEVAESDIVHAEKLSPEQSPFGSLGGTCIFVKRGAQVTHSVTQTRRASEAAPDEFDLDIRGPIRARGSEGPRFLRGDHWTYAIGECGTPNPDPTHYACTN